MQWQEESTYWMVWREAFPWPNWYRQSHWKRPRKRPQTARLKKRPSAQIALSMFLCLGLRLYRSFAFQSFKRKARFLVFFFGWLMGLRITMSGLEYFRPRGSNSKNCLTHQARR